MTTSQAIVPSPLGPLRLTERGGALTCVDFARDTTGAHASAATPLLQSVRQQLAAYFAGELRQFDLPLDPTGTRFQRRAWLELANIPYGEVLTYGELAARLGSGARAVGGACGTNPIPIILPCHRVVAAGGRIGGYAGADGTASKHFLLSLEAAHRAI